MRSDIEVVKIAENSCFDDAGRVWDWGLLKKVVIEPQDGLLLVQVAWRSNVFLDFLSEKVEGAGNSCFSCIQAYWCRLL